MTNEIDLTDLKWSSYMQHWLLERKDNFKKTGSQLFAPNPQDLDFLLKVSDLPTDLVDEIENSDAYGIVSEYPEAFFCIKVQDKAGVKHDFIVLHNEEVYDIWALATNMSVDYFNNNTSEDKKAKVQFDKSFRIGLFEAFVYTAMLATYKKSADGLYELEKTDNEWVSPFE